jgi:hypothetical protein
MPVATIAQTPVKFNQIPSDSSLLKKIKPLKKDEHVQYRLRGAFDPKRPGQFFGRTLVLPTQDTISDPDTGETYDIAFIEGVGPGGIPKVGTIMFEDFNLCLITLKGNSGLDQRKYNYIELCNFLADNPDRDKNKPALIERVNEAEDLKYKRDKRKKVQNALLVVDAMTDTEVLNFVRANRMADAGTPEKRRAGLEDVAEKNPDKFIDMPTIDYTSNYQIIDDAKKAKIIMFNTVTREWQRFDGTPIMTVKKGFGVSNKEELAMFLVKEEGRKSLEWIKTELKK